MDNQDRPRDSDPSEMTDFEKNATTGELERMFPEPEPAPDEEPAFTRSEHRVGHEIDRAAADALRAGQTPPQAAGRDR